jgi:hypothetical protein
VPGVLGLADLLGLVGDGLPDRVVGRSVGVAQFQAAPGHQTEAFGVGGEVVMDAACVAG